MTNKDIKAIIFDFGGVLSSIDNLEEIGRHLAKKYGTPTNVLNEITRSGWKKARTNPKHDLLFWSEIAGALGISVKRLRADYVAFPQLQMETAGIVRSLKKRYIIGMLSNQIATWHQVLMKRWRLQKLFNPIVTSYGEGFAKPDLRIYKRLLRKLRLPAETIVYIDDVKKNLLPAKLLGMKTIHFKNPAQLKRALKKIGVE